MTTALAQKYVSLWNEPDASVRRKLIEEIYAVSGTHILQPPQEMKAAAVGLGFAAPLLRASGHDELEARVTKAYEDFVAPGENVFRVDGVEVLDGVVKVDWAMVPAGGGDPVGGGTEFMVLDAEGRVEKDYQFIGA